MSELDDRPEAATGRGWRLSTSTEWRSWHVGVGGGVVFRCWYFVLQLGPWTVRLARGFVAVV